MKIHESNFGDFTPVPAGPHCQPVQTRQLTIQQPDLHIQFEHEGVLAARCSLWWSNPPAVPHEKTAFIGHFAAEDSNAAEQLLIHAEQHIKARSCTLLIGPMDGATWFPYRFVTETGTRPPFIMEPTHPPAYPEYFKSFGFTPYAEYESSVVDAACPPDSRIQKVAERLARSGVSIRNLRPEALEDELRAIHRLSLKSFADNILYSPISESAFLNLYLSYREIIHPEFAFIAEHNQSVVGFCFSIPDLIQPKFGLQMDTLIIKTLAIAPGSRYAGLGSVLAERIHLCAQEHGFNYIIHALKAVDNLTNNITQRYGGKLLRRYTLFAKRISQQPTVPSPL